MSLVPILCNILAKLFEPTQSSVQMKVQAGYFPFQVIQVFLITTFASGAASVAAQIVQSPTTAPTLLAQTLPKASNFYISYFILFGLLTAALQLLNVGPLLFIVVLGSFRTRHHGNHTNATSGWGSVYPKFTNLGVIALSYSSIAPLVLGFAAIGFSLLSLALRYNALFTLGTNVSTRGESYARALKQLITGIYLSEVCVIGLFAIGVGSSNGPLVLLVATVAWLQRVLKKLEQGFPNAEHLPYQGTDADDAEKGVNAPSSHPKQPLKNSHSFIHRLNAFFSFFFFFFFFFFRPRSSNHFFESRNFTSVASTHRNDMTRHTSILLSSMNECPGIWIAKDEGGLSKQEISDRTKEVGEGLETSDEGAWITPRGEVGVV
ncbi:hypothetical protein AC579_3026 [Pseudocercospora musae]|uniref:CSC1/OSCA1-like 7TM region domain-containing protein n=1 Tax=Pseudocercospora musae TaxID=113226 RepID=A0A139HC27_9PEZI|nr:hypothetical protein AC579_3026 [Pseudocercospora musae]